MNSSNTCTPAAPKTDQPSCDAVELERRAGGGMRVRLLWLPEHNGLLVEQLDIGSKAITYRETPNGQGLDVFHHPEVYPETQPKFSPNVVRGEIEVEALY